MILSQSSNFECLYLLLGPQDRIGFLLIYCSPWCPTNYLPELREAVSDLWLRAPRFAVLGDLDISAQTALAGAAQNFMAAMRVMGLSQTVMVSTHIACQIFDFVFSGNEVHDLVLREIFTLRFPWINHYLVRFRCRDTQNPGKGGEDD